MCDVFYLAVAEPLPRRDAPPPAAAGPVEKSTMVSVGKIAPSVDNAVMHTLLGACGAVKSWKRAEDPETKVLKGFGFCEFQEAEGVLRAIRLLNGFKVDGQELVIKGNSATQRYVEQYEADKLARRAKEAAARVEAAKKKQEEGEVGNGWAWWSSQQHSPPRSPCLAVASTTQAPNPSSPARREALKE
ncbi:hypothetical protein V8C86DRAFT_1796301 [Haematococcus lacustris]